MLQAAERAGDATGSQGLNEGKLAHLEFQRAEAMATQPPYDAMIATVVDCYHMLDSTRSIGMAVGPIPVTAVWQWCERRQLDEELTQAIASAINYLDAERRRAEASKRAQKSNPRSKQP